MRPALPNVKLINMHKIITHITSIKSICNNVFEFLGALTCLKAAVIGPAGLSSSYVTWGLYPAAPGVIVVGDHVIPPFSFDSQPFTIPPPFNPPYSSLPPVTPFSSDAKRSAGGNRKIIADYCDWLRSYRTKSCRFKSGYYNF